MLPDEGLLRAAFDQGGRAAAAWSGWSLMHDLGALHPFEQRLLPAVYRTLLDAGVAEAEIPSVVKQTYRSLLVRTRLLLREVAPLVERLAGHGVPSLLLKGAALVAAYGQHAGARPMSDFDLLVRPEQALAAAAFLEGSGWRSVPRLDRAAVGFLHSFALKKGEAACDLHWYALWGSRDAAADRRFWSGATTAVLDGVTVRVLRAEHMIPHLLAHGVNRSSPTGGRWIGDVLQVLRAREAGLDWDLLANEVEARQLEYPTGEALDYLRESFAAVIPDGVVARLRSRRPSRAQRALYSPRPGAGRDGEGSLWRQRYDTWLRQPADAPLLRRLLWLPRRMQYGWRLESVAGVPGEGARRGALELARLWKRTTQRASAKRASIISST